MNTFSPGDRVSLLKDIKNIKKSQQTVDCFKCGGEKVWVNPNNEDDVRECLTCKGIGTVVSFVDDMTDGKRAFVTYAKGTMGIILSYRLKGKFNSRDVPSEENIEVLIQTDSGLVRTSYKNVKNEY